MSANQMAKLTRREFIAGSGALAGSADVIASTQLSMPGGAASTMRASFRPGETWLDTTGKPIQAHGGSIIYIDNKYYWYGENKEFTTGKTEIFTWGVRCYSSIDLYNWDDLGLIIPPDTKDRNSPLHPATGLDRPHILCNSRTNRFVCWIKRPGLDGIGPTHSLLVADTITGPYTIVHRYIRPLGMYAGDFDLVVSPDDAKAYVYFNRAHTELICADLTDDYQDFTGYYSTHFPRPGPPFTREGPAYFRRGSKHYLATSGTTGYFPNPSEIAVADTFHGPFAVLGDLHPSDRSRTSFNSQISCIFKHPKKKDLYIAMADRWMGPIGGPEFSLIQSALRKWYSSPPQPLSDAEMKVTELYSKVNTSLARYVWLPIRLDSGRPVIEWRSEWSLDEFE
jgi:hypothetical protein